MGDIVGCDVSKGRIDVHIVDSTRGHDMRVANEHVAIRKWAQGLAEGSAEVPCSSFIPSPMDGASE